MLSKKTKDHHSKVDHSCHINFTRETKLCRMVGIVATIGASTRNVETLCKLVKAGMNVVRINFAHERLEDHKLSIKYIREAVNICSKEMGHYIPVAIAADLKGRKITTGLIASRKPVEIKRGEIIKLTINEGLANRGIKDVIYIDYPGIIRYVHVGQVIYIDDNAISVEVVEVGVDCLTCRILNDGYLRNNVSVVVPGSSLDLPVVSEKDIDDIKFSIENNVDFLFLSKLRTAADVRHVRKILTERGKNIKLFTKLENAEALQNLDEILEESDGVIFARADLSIELNVFKIFLAQKAVAARCNRVGKPIICATQLLMSMNSCNIPKRSDIADIGNAILDGSDCLLLSSETAIGLYPLEALQTLDHACREAEEAVWHQKIFRDLVDHNPAAYDGAHAVAISAVMTSVRVMASAIFVMTASGKSAQLLSMYRPPCPIFAITRCSRVARQVHIARGIFSVLIPAEITDKEKRLSHALNVAIRNGMVNANDAVVVLSPHKDATGFTNNVSVLYAQFEKKAPEHPHEQKF